MRLAEKTYLARFGTWQDRFARSFVKSDGCWLWAGDIDRHGYGRCSIRGKVHPAHRVALHLHNGFDLLSTSLVLHSCHVRHCVNPAHLREGTHQENAIDKVLAGRAVNGSPRSLPYGVHKGRRGGFFVQFTLLNEAHYCGTFPTIEQAAEVALQKKAELLMEVSR